MTSFGSRVEPDDRELIAPLEKTIGREASRLEGLRLRRGGAMRVSARIGEARRAAEAALDALKARVNQL